MDNVTAYRAYRLRPLGLIPLIALGLLSTLATTDPGPPDLDFSGPSSLDIPIPNLRRPSVDAGPDQLVLENSVVTLSAEVINDGGGITSMSWSQTGGPTVLLDTPGASTTIFTAPSVDVRTELTFLFVAFSRARDSDAVTITVDPDPAIDTTVDWNGEESLQAFGDGSANEVFGQTFVTPADQPILQRLSFWLQHSPDDTSGEDAFFSIIIMGWNTDRATGPVLYESQLQSITAAQSIMTEYVVDTGGLILVPGEKYVAFLSANNGFWNATSTLIRVGWQNVDVYPDGESWILDTDNDASLIAAAAWENPFGAADFVVLLTF